MSQQQPSRPIPIPLPALRNYGIDSSGMVWRMNVMARSRSGNRVDKPLSGVTLPDLSKVLGRSHSNRDKAPHLLMPGIWQLRPFHEVLTSDWRGNFHDYLRQHAAEFADGACWFQISLREHTRPRRALSFSQAHDHSPSDSRDHFPYIVAGKLAFRELQSRNT